MKKIISAVITAAMLLTTAAGCAPAENIEENERLEVVTTLFPQYDFTRQIAGDKAEITLLLPSGMESHSYEPTPSDRIKAGRCDLFIYTGEYMEPWAGGIVSDISENGVSVLDVSQGITLGKTEDEHHHDEEHEGEEEHEEHETEEEHDEHVHEVDPHIWTDPNNAIIMVDSILAELVALDPENAAYYNANAESYKAELSELDNELRGIAEGGKRRKLYFGGRFAFYYLTERYGLEYEAAYDSCSTEAEPTARRIAEISDDIKEDGIPVIYYEELTDPKIARSLSDELGIKMLMLHSCHNLSQEDYNNGETYISLMKRNAENIREGLN